MSLKRYQKVKCAIIPETFCTQIHVHAAAHRRAHTWGGDAVLCIFVLTSFREIFYLPSFVFRKTVREGVRSFFSPVLFTVIFFSPVLPRLMAHFKRRNCSQFISGMQSATLQRCARHPQSPNTISSPIKQHQRQSSTPRWEFLESSRLRTSTLWRKLSSRFNCFIRGAVATRRRNDRSLSR